MKLEIKIPEHVKFADLNLSIEPGGGISFDRSVIETICKASGISAEVLAQEDDMAELIIRWYLQARARGEPADPTQEELLAEIKLENERGGGISLPPGSA